MRFLICIILVSFAISCSPGESKLSKALTSAVKDKKVSQKKMESILREYERLREDNQSIASEYADMVVRTIEFGGDSTHIDVIRKQVLKKRDEGKVGV